MHVLMKNQGIISASIIGSSSNMYREIVDFGSDIDLVIIWEKEWNWFPFKEELNKEISKVDGNIALVDIWGVACPIVLNKPIIHLHNIGIDQFEKWSTLYKRSIGKYEPVLGIPLSQFVPNTVITLSEMLLDSLGPYSLLKRLENKEFYDIKWLPPDFATPSHSPPCASEPIDFLLYAVLHSSRNILRFFNLYDEFCTLEILCQKWDVSGGPHVEVLRYFVKVKKARRQFRTAAFSENNMVLGEMFLKSAILWMEQKYYSNLKGKNT